MGIITTITGVLFILGIILYFMYLISENCVLLFIAILTCAVGSIMAIIIKMEIVKILLTK